MSWAEFPGNHSHPKTPLHHVSYGRRFLLMALCQIVLIALKYVGWWWWWGGGFDTANHGRQLPPTTTSTAAAATSSTPPTILASPPQVRPANGTQQHRQGTGGWRMARILAELLMNLPPEPTPSPTGYRRRGGRRRLARYASLRSDYIRAEHGAVVGAIKLLVRYAKARHQPKTGSHERAIPQVFAAQQRFSIEDR